MSIVVGVPACSKTVNGEPQHSTPTRYGNALIGAAGAIPVLLPPVGELMLDVLDRLDGLLLSGSPSNVEPARYGTDPSLTPTMHDPARDGTTLPLALEAIRRGMPLLAICRGIQELNVALGGSLHQQVHLLDGRADHRAGEGELDHLFRLKHTVRVSGELALVLGTDEVLVNSLHEQALDRIADGLEIEAVAEDGTVEAVRVRDAEAFAFGVQFHPEWHWATDEASRIIFRSFGEACRKYQAQRRTWRLDAA